jgi:aminoacyl tRNA synthase complex-interacting multifunctional protein 1
VRIHIEQLKPAFSLVQFDLENAPTVERKAEPSKKKEKKERVAAPVETAASTKTKAAELVDGNTSKKEKKEKKEAVVKGEESGKKKATGGPKPAITDDSGEPVPSMIDLRVGHIVDGRECCLIPECKLIVFSSKKTSGC